MVFMFEKSGMWFRAFEKSAMWRPLLRNMRRGFPFEKSEMWYDF